MSDRIADLLVRIEALEAQLSDMRRVAAAAPADDESSCAGSDGHRDEAPASRRELLRYGVAAATAVAVGLTKATEPLHAGVDGDVVLGGSNITSANTFIQNTSTNPLSHGLVVSCSGAPSNTAIHGAGAYHGVNGRNATTGAAGGAGVYGESVRADGYGVFGGNGLQGGTGVFGAAVEGTGVLAESLSGNAVLGRLPSYAEGVGVAVYGLNYSRYAGPGPGAGGFGVYGLSAKGHGLVGATATAGAAAVVGATNGVSGSYAGAFYGPVIVGGNFTVVGGAKSAAVPHPDGSHRRLYCVESPESWFEDFGQGTLACGEAFIALDPDFAAVVDTAHYHVFLTACDGAFDLLSTSNKTAEGFRVRAASTEASGTFSWRVVAKRKDIAGPRLERVEIPREPPLPDVPPAQRRPARSVQAQGSRE